MKKLRRIFITWNNYQDVFKDVDNNINWLEIESFFQNLKDLDGYIVGAEIGESGTRHLQGVLFFKQQKTFNTLRLYLPGCHIEPIKSLKSSLVYVKKEGNYKEFGNVRSQGSRSDIEDFKEAIIAGYTDMELLEEYTSQYFKFNNQISKVRELVLSEYYSVNLRKNLQVMFLAGDSGSGKTSTIYKRFGFSNVYRITDYKRDPFGAYAGEKVLVLDEYNNDFSIQELNNYLDIYPLQLPSRYYNKWAAFEYVFIISNFSFSELYNLNYYSVEILQSLKRRIHFNYYLTKKAGDLDNLNLIIDKMINMNDLAF